MQCGKLSCETRGSYPFSLLTRVALADAWEVAICSVLGMSHVPQKTDNSCALFQSQHADSVAANLAANQCKVH